MKTKTRILTTLLAIVLSFTLFSAGSINVLASSPDECDIHGTPISYWIPTLAGMLDEKLWTTDLPYESIYNTFIFLDSQLMDYNFIEALCDMYSAQTEEGATGVARLYYAYGIQIFVHTNGWTFTNITMQELGAEQYIFDFADQSTYNQLYDLVGQVGMCGMGILNMDSGLYSFLLHYQAVWQNLCQTRMPVYSIQRDPISHGSVVDGLWTYICNLYPLSSGGATGGWVQYIPNA